MPDGHIESRIAICEKYHGLTSCGAVGLKHFFSGKVPALTIVAEMKVADAFNIAASTTWDQRSARSGEDMAA
jgi:hypothetical protein